MYYTVIVSMYGRFIYNDFGIFY